MHAFVFTSFIARTVIKWCPIATLSCYGKFYKDVTLKRVSWKHAELVCIPYAIMCPVYMLQLNFLNTFCVMLFIPECWSP